MPMNITSSDLAIMQVLAAILPVGTSLAAGGGQVYIQDRYELSLGQFPALHLAAGAQSRRRNSNHSFLGQTTIRGTYYDRWDSQVLRQDQIRAQAAADLEIMLGNLETNDRLEYNGAIRAISLANIALSPYDGEFDDKLIPGAVLVMRWFDATFNVLPYFV